MNDLGSDGNAAVTFTRKGSYVSAYLDEGIVCSSGKLTSLQCPLLVLRRRVPGTEDLPAGDVRRYHQELFHVSKEDSAMYLLNAAVQREDAAAVVFEWNRLPPLPFVFTPEPASANTAIPSLGSL